MLCSARSACQASIYLPVAPKSNKFRHKQNLRRVRAFSRENLHDFESMTPKIFGAKCITDSAQSFSGRHDCCVAHAAHAGRVLRAGDTKSAPNLQHIPAFSRETLLDFERPHRKMSVPSTALTRQKAAPMSCVLHSARGRCRPNFASAPRNRILKNCVGIARFLAQIKFHESECRACRSRPTCVTCAAQHA